eukprot:m.93219 g.93219  ORF g.93219 m.93219 type:complete len:182 (+) comp13391_c0_seq1:90-635(+)
MAPTEDPPLPHLDIDWETIGEETDENIPGGDVPYALDSELEEVLQRDAWDKFAERVIRKGKAVNWGEKLPMRVGTYINGNASGTGEITSWKSANGDRFELWSVEGQSHFLNGDRLAALELNSGEKLIVGCNMCHPYVTCNVICFGNTDGSSKWEPLLSTSPADLLEAIVNRATEYLFDQDH